MKLCSGPISNNPKILCISLGSIGLRHLRNARALIPQAEIAVWRQHTVGDGSIPDGANHSLPSIQAALDFKPDAVIISSPASEHLRNASAFVERGVPVFLEKPIAADASEVGNFSMLCAASPGFTMVGYVLRFLPTLHVIRRHLAEGLIGKVHTARIEVGQYLPDWRPASDYRLGVSGQAKLGGGALLELSHEIDYATWLFGWPETLQCSCAHLSALEIDVEDSAHVVLEYQDKRISLQLDFLQRVANMAMQIVGSSGTLTADLMTEQIRWTCIEHPKGVMLDAPKLSNGNEIYMRQFDFFFHKAIQGYAPRYEESPDFSAWSNVESALKVLRIVDLAKQASDSGVRQVFSK